MNKSPSVKFLVPLFLFTIIINTSYSYTSWAYFLDQAKEYRIKADKLQSEGKLDQAIEYYQKTIGLDRYCVAASNGLAICYEKKGWLRRAEEEYLQVLEINPAYAPAHYNLGLLYKKYGDIRKAVFHWKQRMRLGHPGDPGALKAKAKLKKYAPEELKKEQARELAQRIMQQKEEDVLDKTGGKKKYRTKEEKIQDNYLEGMQFYQRGDYQKTAECFHKMIETLPISK